jgi:CRISPR type IV-associated protein Csf3
MEPLCITWLVDTMAESHYPMHLDSLIANAKFQYMLQNDGILIEDHDQTVDAFVAGLDLPLAKETRLINGVEKSCWQASAIVPEKILSSGLRSWVRHVDAVDIAHAIKVTGDVKYRGDKIDTKRGVLKQNFKFIAVNQPSCLKAWCIGDHDEILELLDVEKGFVTHIGPRKRLGLGHIRSMTIERDERAFELWQKRSSPWPYEGAIPMEIATQQPYWAPQNRGMGWIDPALFAAHKYA